MAAAAGMEDPNGRSDANAHLIAAAPDLYAALDAVLSALYAAHPQELARRVDIANAALAKARGEA